MAHPDWLERITDPTARALKLLSLLQAQRHWKGAELAERLGVSERTVRRDVDRLRGLGYRLEAGPGVDGGYQLAAGGQVPPLLLDDDEAVALIVGVRASALASIQGIENTSVSLMAKLDQLLPDHVRRRVEALHGSVEVLAWTHPPELLDASTLTVLGQACRDHEEVRFTYRRRDGEESRRLVQPARLVSAGRRWYLVAWDVRRNDWRTFRVDRIESPAPGGLRFDPRPMPAVDAASFVAEGLRTMDTDYEAVVVANSDRETVQGLIRWFDADAEEIEGGLIRLRLRAESVERLASMIAVLAISVDVDIVEAPDDVRALIAGAVTRLGVQCASAL
jgi:predicted DNA-binding transcriptional regulator YafY